MSIAAVAAAIGSGAVLVALVLRRGRRPHEEALFATSMRSPVPMISALALVDHTPQANGADDPGLLHQPAATNGIAPPAADFFAPPPQEQPPAPPLRSERGTIVAASGPHPSGLGAVELAAMVEEGLADLASDVSEIERMLAIVVERASLPDDLPDRPAVEQRHLAAQLDTQVTEYLAHLVPLVEQVADDLGRADRALMEVRAELVRIGLRPDFFTRMDASAASIALRIPELDSPASMLVRRFGALSALFSTLRPIHQQIENVVASLQRANNTTAPWRGEATLEIDLRDPVRPHPASLQ